MLQIGVTGGIGSGKSLVCKIFSTLGAAIYDADSRAKWLTNNDAKIKEEITAHFGPEAYNSTGLNRDFIAKKVFNNGGQLQTLNSIIHPAVGIDYKNWVDDQNAPYVVKEAALMFESGSYKTLDKVINVSAPLELRIARVLKRDAFRSREEVLAIISKQLSEEERNERSDYVIINDERQMLLPQVIGLHERFKLM
jgi:dephospho-CoA kinase